jgi:hypothetical protein
MTAKKRRGGGSSPVEDKPSKDDPLFKEDEWRDLIARARLADADRQRLSNVLAISLDHDFFDQLEGARTGYWFETGFRESKGIVPERLPNAIDDLEKAYKVLAKLADRPSVRWVLEAGEVLSEFDKLVAAMPAAIIRAREQIKKGPDSRPLGIAFRTTVDAVAKLEAERGPAKRAHVNAILDAVLRDLPDAPENNETRRRRYYAMRANIRSAK